MILFKVSFKNNIAVSAIPSLAHKQIEWKENPYTILSMDVYANNNAEAVKKAQQKASLLSQQFK